MLKSAACILLLNVLCVSASVCETDWDCSLAGICVNGACECDNWMTGPKCELLNLVKPTDPAKQGLQMEGYYSWGGHTVYDEEHDIYQGFFSFMCKHSTLQHWTTVSSIVRATSVKPEGPFEVQEMIMQPWAHNTMITFDPQSNKHLLVFIGTAEAPKSLWDPCVEMLNLSSSNVQHGATTTNQNPEPVHHDSRPWFVKAGSSRAPQAGDVTIATSPSLTGNWTIFHDYKPTPVFGGPNINFSSYGTWGEFVAGNPAPVIFENGTTLLYYTASPCPENWGMSPACIGVARADNWVGPYTTVGTLPITRPESEDPFVFRDSRSNFHLLTNINTGHHRCPIGVACGGHAWSHDGITWSNLTIGAYGPKIPLQNGSVWENSYIERPQVITDKKGNPVAFYTGLGRANYTDSCSWAQRFCTSKNDPGCAPTGKICHWENQPNGAFNHSCH